MIICCLSKVCFTFPRASRLCCFLLFFFSSADLFPDLSGAIQTLFHEAHLWNAAVFSLSSQSEQKMQFNQNQYFTKVRRIVFKKKPNPQNKQNSQILSVLTMTLDSSVNFLFCLHFPLVKEQFGSCIISSEKSFFTFALL